jgi:hypothetical protein
MSLPYGLRDVKISPITAATGVVGTPVDLPNAQTFSFEEAEEFTELRGDDKVVATRGTGASVSWELGAGGIDLAAYALMNGGVVVVSGTGATAKKTYTKKTTDIRPEFKVEGQAMSESGGDFHAVVYRCKATEGVNGSLEDGEFWVTSASGTALGNSSDTLYDLVENATATAIAVV